MSGPSKSPAQDSSPIPIPITTTGRNLTENLSQEAQNAQSDKERRSSSKNFVKRAVEHTTAKLSASSSSSSLGRRESDLKNGRSPAGSRSLLSLTRTRPGKERDPDSRSPFFTSEGRRSAALSPAQLVESPQPLNPRTTEGLDDSPFIRPRSCSPSLPPVRPPIDMLNRFGSMHAGTQTLIQALHAFPWQDDLDDVDADMAQTTDPESYSEDGADDISGGQPSAAALSSDEDGGSSESDDESRDETPRDSRIVSRTPVVDIVVEDAAPSRIAESGTLRQLHKTRMLHSLSLSTVRLKRGVKLAAKLKEVFKLDTIQDVIAELPCWLLRSVPLQGHIYLTNSHLCFFAHLTTRENQVLKSGSVTKRTQRTKRWVKHWFVLRNDVLSWYQSSSDPYFPHGVVDLRHAISCEPVQQRIFRIKTPQKTVSLMADSEPSRNEWVKAIRKVMLKAQNFGEDVKIAIPYSVVVDVEKSSAMDFTEAIEVKVVDKDENTVDSYFFAYFRDTVTALNQIRDVVRAYVQDPQSSSAVTEVIHDTTTHSQASTSPAMAERSVSSRSDPTGVASYAYRLVSLVRPSAHEPTSPVYTTSPRSSESFQPLRLTTSPLMRASSTSLATLKEVPHTGTSSSPETPTANPINATSNSHTYPPPPSPLVPSSSPGKETATRSWTVPSWLRGSSKRILGTQASASSTTVPVVPADRSVSESALTRTSSSSASASGFPDLGFSVLETREAAEPEVVDKFHSAFALDDKEILLGYFPGYLFRLLPTYGRLYVSPNYFCFKSSGPLASKTRMMIPIRDLLALEKSSRFGQHGVIVIIKGHEELFFEFSSVDRRTAFMNLLERQMEEVRRRMLEGVQETKDGKLDALDLEALQSTDLLGSKPRGESMAESLPAVMFASNSSTFLTFKPQEPLHFTFLTIGSRGDVQPYIALGKGLIADGHKVRIATHGEFKEWIESHGIEFGYVGGDPAELMRICVENGTFTVSFLKEGMTKFRGWIDDLLKTSWEACQNTDVLVESPSAMGGIHIAEALGIPYFRAFTMPWSRTRTYPHAFAVPERKMGGGYNYMSYVLFDQVFWRAISGQINRWRKNTLHIPGTNLERLDPHKVPFLYNFSPSVVPPPLDWPEWIKVTGYWFLDDAEVSKQKWTPPQDLVNFIDNAHQAGGKVVYIGFGSVVVPDPEAMTRCVVEAIERSGVYAILSKGWSDRLQAKKDVDVTEPEIPLPSQVYRIKSIPHDWLFKRIDAACHHGGAGTTGASLRAGIPTIIKPFFGDQFFWGDRVEALGIGTSVRKLSVESLTEALVNAVNDKRQIERAKYVGEHIRAENGVNTAIEVLYRELEYARSLIKTHRAAGDDASSDEEDGALREQRRRISLQSASDRGGASPGAPSEDWSVISDHEDRRMSAESDAIQPEVSRRTSIRAAVRSVLPHSLTHTPKKSSAPS